MKCWSVLFSFYWMLLRKVRVVMISGSRYLLDKNWIERRRRARVVHLCGRRKKKAGRWLAAVMSVFSDGVARSIVVDVVVVVVFVSGSQDFRRHPSRPLSTEAGAAIKNAVCAGD